MCKPSFQGLSPEARRVFPFDTVVAIVLAVEVDLVADQVGLLLSFPCIFGIILVFSEGHYECTHHKHNSCTRYGVVLSQASKILPMFTPSMPNSEVFTSRH